MVFGGASPGTRTLAGLAAELSGVGTYPLPREGTSVTVAWMKPPIDSTMVERRAEPLFARDPNTRARLLQVQQPFEGIAVVQLPG